MRINGTKIVGIEIERYEINDNIAISLYCEEEGTKEKGLFSCITTNTNAILLNDNDVALDTNNCSWVENWVKKYKLGYQIGVVKSGFCIYPIYEMDLKKIEELNHNLLKEELLDERY